MYLVNVVVYFIYEFIKCWIWLNTDSSRHLECRRHYGVSGYLLWPLAKTEHVKQTEDVIELKQIRSLGSSCVSSQGNTTTHYL